MNDETAVIPPWLHDVFLGYGDPAAAQARVPGTTAAAADGDAAGVGGQPPLQTIDFGDTFLDAEHVVEAFPQFKASVCPKTVRRRASRSSTDACMCAIGRVYGVCMSEGNAKRVKTLYSFLKV